MFPSPICAALCSPTVQLTPTSSCCLGRCSLLVSDRVPLSPCADPESAAQAKQNLLTPLIKPTGPVPWAVGEEGRLGLIALIPVFHAMLLLGDSLEDTAAITTAASGSVIPF